MCVSLGDSQIDLLLAQTEPGSPPIPLIPALGKFTSQGDPSGE